MRKILGVIAGLAAMLSLGVGAAQAASNGSHVQGFTCSTTQNGSTVSITGTLSYNTSGVGTSAANKITPTRAQWRTSPAAKLSRMAFLLGPDYDELWYSPYSGSDSMPSSGSSTTGMHSLTFPNGNAGAIQMFVFGGAGVDSNANGTQGAYCQRTYDSL